MLKASEGFKSDHKIFTGEKFWCYDQTETLRPAAIVEGELTFWEENDEVLAVYYVEYRGK